jgi:hypothetical protein
MQVIRLGRTKLSYFELRSLSWAAHRTTKSGSGATMAATSGGSQIMAAAGRTISFKSLMMLLAPKVFWMSEFRIGEKANSMRRTKRGNFQS